MKNEKATFAGGCFWCMETPFDQLEGVTSVTVGYTGGKTENPTYEEVCSGKTGHAEAVEIVFNPEKITFEKLLSIFWKNIDPTVKDRQFCDIGTQYRTAVFYHSDEQKRLAEDSRTTLPFDAIFTEIVPAETFYPAEDYHQKFYQKSPLRYEMYKKGSGRAERLQQLWSEPE